MMTMCDTPMLVFEFCAKVSGFDGLSETDKGRILESMPRYINTWDAVTMIAKSGSCELLKFVLDKAMEKPPRQMWGIFVRFSDDAVERVLAGCNCRPCLSGLLWNHQGAYAEETTPRRVDLMEKYMRLGGRDWVALSEIGFSSADAPRRIIERITELEFSDDVRDAIVSNLLANAIKKGMYDLVIELSDRNLITRTTLDKFDNEVDYFSETMWYDYDSLEGFNVGRIKHFLLDRYEFDMEIVIPPYDIDFIEKNSETDKFQVVYDSLDLAGKAAMAEMVRRRDSYRYALVEFAAENGLALPVVNWKTLIFAIWERDETCLAHALDNLSGPAPPDPAIGRALYHGSTDRIFGLLIRHPAVQGYMRDSVQYADKYLSAEDTETIRSFGCTEWLLNATRSRGRREVLCVLRSFNRTRSAVLAYTVEMKMKKLALVSFYQCVRTLYVDRHKRKTRQITGRLAYEPARSRPDGSVWFPGGLKYQEGLARWSR